MIYTLYTLVDVTETGEHHGPDEKLVNQQANYNTLIQVLGLRANPTPRKTVSHVDSLAGLGFGASYKGKQRYWEFEFEIEYGEVAIDSFKEDFDLVPIITGLDETVNIKTPVFFAGNDKSRNLVITSFKD